MAKEIITDFVCGDFELHLMCSKPETFEGFAENACNLFFPEIQKYNLEKVEPVDLVPFGFLQAHTYFDTIYFPRALEWKFTFEKNKNQAKDFENDLAVVAWFIGKSFENTDDSKTNESEKIEKLNEWVSKAKGFKDDLEIVNWFIERSFTGDSCGVNNTEVEDCSGAEEWFETVNKVGSNLELLICFIKKRLDNKASGAAVVTEEFLRVKKWLNDNFVFLPEKNIVFLSEQGLFLEVGERIFERQTMKEGFEKTRELTLKHAIAPRFLNRMSVDLKKVLGVFTDNQILDFVFKEHNAMDGLKILSSKGECFLKVLFDLLNHENVNELLSENNFTPEFYEIMAKFKMPNDLGEIIKVCPLFYAFIDNEASADKVKSYLENDKSKSDFIKNLIKYVQKKSNNRDIIYSYLDIINKNLSVQEFLLEISKVSDLDTVKFLVSEYKDYFSNNTLQAPIEKKSALAIYLNLYFNFDHETARNVFDIKNENLDILKNKLIDNTGKMNVDYVINFLIGDLPEKEQGDFIKKLGSNTQNKLKELFSGYKDFMTRMKLASLTAKMKNTD